MVPSCTSSPVAPTLTRLPRTQAEGDIPRIALSTGGADALECLLRKIGIDDSEFTNDAGLGRVHLFSGEGGTNAFDPTLGGAAFTAAETGLWSDTATLSEYDIVLL